MSIIEMDPRLVWRCESKGCHWAGRLLVKVQSKLVCPTHCPDVARLHRFEAAPQDGL